MDNPQPDTQPYFRPPPTLGCRWAVGVIDGDGFGWRLYCVLQHNHLGVHEHINGLTFWPPDKPLPT